METTRLRFARWRLAESVLWALLGITSIVLGMASTDSAWYWRLGAIAQSIGMSAESFQQGTQWLAVVSAGACFGAAAGAVRGRQLAWTLAGILASIGLFFGLYVIFKTFRF